MKCISKIFSIFATVGTAYESGMNEFYREVGKLDQKTQMAILGSMTPKRW